MGVQERRDAFVDDLRVCDRRHVPESFEHLESDSRQCDGQQVRHRQRRRGQRK